jgi:RNA polymerase sigma factor (sigma-70 family)
LEARESQLLTTGQLDPNCLKSSANVSKWGIIYFFYEIENFIFCYQWVLEVANEVDLLLNGFLNGDKKSFEKIYMGYYPMLYNYGRQFSVDEEAVDDCIQDVFIEIWNYRRSLIIKSLKPYLFKCLRNKISKYLSRTSRDLERAEKYQREEFEIEYDPVALVMDDDGKRELENRLKKGIERLTPRQREIIFLIYYNNLSYKEAADILDIKIKTAYNQIHKSINELRDLLMAFQFGIVFFTPF